MQLWFTKVNTVYHLESTVDNSSNCVNLPSSFNFLTWTRCCVTAKSLHGYLVICKCRIFIDSWVCTTNSGCWKCNCIKISFYSNASPSELNLQVWLYTCKPLYRIMGCPDANQQIISSFYFLHRRYWHGLLNLVMSSQHSARKERHQYSSKWGFQPQFGFDGFLVCLSCGFLLAGVLVTTLFKIHLYLEILLITSRTLNFQWWTCLV